MDQNKLAKLKSIQFSIGRNCGICSHGVFPKDDFGTCAIHTYDHLKHTDTTRLLSINKYGTCHSFKLSEMASIGLGMWKEFLKTF